MANKVLRTRILQKYDTVEKWRSSTLPILKGELAFDETGRYKVGTESTGTLWSNLQYGGSILTLNAIPEIKHESQVGLLVNLTAQSGDYTPGLYLLKNVTEVVGASTPTYTPEWVKIATGEDLAGQIAALTGRVTTLESTVTEHGEQIATLIATTSALGGNIEAIDAKIGTVEQGKTVVEMINDNVTDVIGDIEDGKTVAELIDELDEKIGELPAGVTSVEAQIADIQADYQDQIDEINTKIGDTAEYTGTTDAQGNPVKTEYGAINGETIVSKLVTVNKSAENAIAAGNVVMTMIGTDGKIKKDVLPSYVDDVIEGVVITSDINQDLYTATHDTDNTSAETKPTLAFFRLVDEKKDVSDTSTTVVTKYAPIVDDNSTNLPGETGSYNTIKGENLDVSEYTSLTVNGYSIWTDATYKQKPQLDAIYVDVLTNKTYRWSGSQFVVIASDLALGENSSSAFYGDRGVALEDAVFGDGSQSNPGLVSEVADLKDEVAGLSDNLTETYATKSELANVEGTLSSADAAIQSGLQDQIDAINAKIGNLDDGFIGVDGKETVTAELAYLYERTNSLQDATNANANAIGKDSSEGSDWSSVSGTTVAAKIAGINTRVNDIEDSIEQSDVDLEDLKTRMTNAESSIATNVNAIANNTNAISALASKEEQDIAALVAKENDDYATLTGLISAIQSETTENNLVERVEALEDLTETHTTQIAENTEGIATNASTISALASETSEAINELTATISALPTVDSVTLDKVISNTPQKLDDEDQPYLDLGTMNLIIDCGDSTSETPVNP